jgi:hypothetical protein
MLREGEPLHPPKLNISRSAQQFLAVQGR